MEPVFCIKRNILTDKASCVNKKNCYIFEVNVNANKTDIKRCIEYNFSTKVKEVNIVTIFSKGKKKYTRNGVINENRHLRKKAYVYLKDGESISFNNFS